MGEYILRKWSEVNGEHKYLSPKHGKHTFSSETQ